MKLERNGIDLSLDFGYISVLERVENANSNYMKNQRPAPEGLSVAETFMHYCNEIFVAINEIYAPTHGPDICSAIFNDPQGVNYNTVVDVYKTIISGMGEQQELMAERNLAMARSNTERALRSREIKAEIKNLNEQSKAMVKEDKLRAQKELEAEMIAQRDTSVPYSDISQMPKIPLAVAPALTGPADYATGTPNALYAPTTGYPVQSE